MVVAGEVASVQAGPGTKAGGGISSKSGSVGTAAVLTSAAVSVAAVAGGAGGLGAELEVLLRQ